MQTRYLALGLSVIALLAIGGIYVSSKQTEDALSLQPANAGTVNSLSVTTAGNNAASAGAIGGDERLIRWSSSNFPADAGVNISLIRMINDSPVEYEFVRSIAKNAPNSGSITWTPLPEELGEEGADLYISIECADALSLEQGCTVTANPVRATSFIPEPAPQPTGSE